MSRPPAGLAIVLDHYRRGNLEAARNAAQAALEGGDDNAALYAIAGMIACQQGDPAAGIPHLRNALAAMPGDVGSRVNLATALIATGALDEAADVCQVANQEHRLLRLLAYVHQARGRFDQSAVAYESVVAARPDDFESWNNLGNVRRENGDQEGAIAAFQRAIQVRPDAVPLYLNLSMLLADLERHEARQRVMREAARFAPDDPEVQNELGLAEASAGDFAAAEAAFRAAIRLTPGFSPAYLELAVLLENLNRVDALAELADEAERRGLANGEIAFLRATALRRRGAFAEALPLARSVPDTVNPIRRAHLIGELADRLGDADQAFAAFTEMNQASLEALRAPVDAGPGYRAEVAATAERLTRSWVDSWTRIELAPTPLAPVFIVGFPRSGTTLLDTLLMNLPRFHVLEEMPLFRHVEARLGDPARLASLTSADADALRTHYFEMLDELAPAAPGQRIVDKFPLHMARMPIVHRLFPDAKTIFVERHPCDVVLSCFMSNFELNRAMLNFVTLEDAARLYDTVFQAWTRACELLPLDLHVVRYERMVEDLESEMRSLLRFLDVDWDPAVLDNRAAASRRERISTASYSQVTEPIYRRSSGRWQRYRHHMSDILPILAPWAQRMGYSL